MSTEIYVAYLLATIVIVIVPGPTVTLIVANALTHGTRAGLLNVAGTQAGLAVCIGVVAVGLASLVQAIGWWFDGRASLVIGTHTHVPTADARVLLVETSSGPDQDVARAFYAARGYGEEARVRRERTVALATMDKEVKVAEAAVEVLRLAGKPAHRSRPVSSNVRPHDADASSLRVPECVA